MTDRNEEHVSAYARSLAHTDTIVEDNGGINWQSGSALRLFSTAVATAACGEVTTAGKFLNEALAEEIEFRKIAATAERIEPAGKPPEFGRNFIGQDTSKAYGEEVETPLGKERRDG